MKTEEVNNSRYTIKPTKANVYVESESKLVWYKELICKIFDIKPQRHTYFYAIVYYKEHIRFGVGDIFFSTQDSTRWVVTQCFGGKIEIKNLTPINHKITDIRELVLVGSDYVTK